MTSYQSLIQHSRRQLRQHHCSKRSPSSEIPIATATEISNDESQHNFTPFQENIENDPDHSPIQLLKDDKSSDVYDIAKSIMYLKKTYHHHCDTDSAKELLTLGIYLSPTTEESDAISNLIHMDLHEDDPITALPEIDPPLVDSQLRKNLHIHYFNSELVCRGVIIPTDVKDKTRGLIKLLKSHEGDDISFKPLTNLRNFD